MGTSKEVSVQKHINKIWQAQSKVEKALEKAREQMENFANKHRGELVEFNKGDEVLLKVKNLHIITPSRKLAPKYLRSYIVKRRHELVNYELKLPKTMKIHSVFNVQSLKPYKEKDYYGRPTYDHSKPIVINDYSKYEVESIKNCMRGSKGKYHYLVHWKEYESAYNIWESLRSKLKEAKNAIKEFYNKFSKA